MHGTPDSKAGRPLLGEARSSVDTTPAGERGRLLLHRLREEAAASEKRAKAGSRTPRSSSEAKYRSSRSPAGSHAAPLQPVNTTHKPHEDPSMMLFDALAVSETMIMDTTLSGPGGPPMLEDDFSIIALPTSKNAPVALGRSPAKAPSGEVEEQDMERILETLDRAAVKGRQQGVQPGNATACGSIIIRAGKEKALMSESFLAPIDETHFSGMDTFDRTEFDEVIPPPRPSWYRSPQKPQLENRFRSLASTTDVPCTPESRGSTQTSYKPILPKSLSTPNVRQSPIRRSTTNARTSLASHARTATAADPRQIRHPAPSDLYDNHARTTTTTVRKDILPRQESQSRLQKLSKSPSAYPLPKGSISPGKVYDNAPSRTPFGPPSPLVASPRKANLNRPDPSTTTRASAGFKQPYTARLAEERLAKLTSSPSVRSKIQAAAAATAVPSTRSKDINEEGRIGSRLARPSTRTPLQHTARAPQPSVSPHKLFQTMMANKPATLRRSDTMPSQPTTKPPRYEARSSPRKQGDQDQKDEDDGVLRRAAARQEARLADNRLPRVASEHKTLYKGQPQVQSIPRSTSVRQGLLPSNSTKTPSSTRDASRSRPTTSLSKSTSSSASPSKALGLGLERDRARSGGRQDIPRSIAGLSRSTSSSTSLSGSTSSSASLCKSTTGIPAQPSSSMPRREGVPSGLPTANSRAVPVPRQRPAESIQDGAKGPLCTPYRASA